jgi:hypothetical protein
MSCVLLCAVDCNDPKKFLAPEVRNKQEIQVVLFAILCSRVLSEVD